MTKRGWLVPILVSFICIFLLFNYQSNFFKDTYANPSPVPTAPWDFNSSNITKLILSEKAHSITFHKDDATKKWVFSSPLSGNADSSLIYDLISTFNAPPLLSATKLEDVSADALKAYGIDSKSKRIQMIDEEDTTYTLIQGDWADEKSYYAYEPVSKILYTVHHTSFDKISLTSSDWREKAFLNFNATNTAKIVFTFKEHAYTITQNSATPSIDFISDSLDQTTVDEMIQFLKTLKATSFVANEATPQIQSSYGFDRPYFQLDLYEKEGTIRSYKVAYPALNSYYMLDMQTQNIYGIPPFKPFIQ